MEETKKYHFVGINGIGMSALAQILLEKQSQVSGSDLSLTAISEKLIRKGAKIYKGHSSEQVHESDTVVLSSQIAQDNPEYLEALKLNCKVLHRSELLAQLCEGYETFAVTGSHGKTTTSSLLSAVLLHAGLDPTFAIGGMLAGTNGRLGKSHNFVLEADESDASFLNYFPMGAIVTNIGNDHLDHYKTQEALHAAFGFFLTQVKNKELLFYCADDAVLKRLSKGQGVSYGFDCSSDLVVSNYRQEGWRSCFDLSFEKKSYLNVSLSLLGEHNALNAAAVFGLALKIGVAEDKIREALEHFPGVGRRCEKRGECSSVLFIDDYAHHPTEIAKTLYAVKKTIEERRLVVLFQPHRYSRVELLQEEFAKVFEMADFLYVTDIYGAGEPPILGIDAHLLIEKIKKNSLVPCVYLPKEKWCEELNSSLMPHDVLLTLGAGDITRLHVDLMPGFRPKKLKVGLIFGGKSCEHEISIRSARCVAPSLNRSLYDVQFLGIDKEGKWVIGGEAEELLFSQNTLSSDNALPLYDARVLERLEACDLFMPILHGTYGEDGTMQGFFELLEKPYSGPDYRAAAICMDKVLTKRLVASCGIKTPKDITFGKWQWQECRKQLLAQISEELVFPLYVKPVHLGSSVGISKVDAASNLEEAIEKALRFDVQVLVEEGKEGCRELEFAVLGNAYSFPICAPGPGEKLAGGEFVDYEMKYGQMAVKTTLEPHLSPQLLEKGQSLAKKAYAAALCSGMARVDFLLDQEGEFWLFEINTIPGLQRLSLFPKIWQREGVMFEQLIDRLIILALARTRQQRRACAS